ncbi:MAG: hypothetical protein KBD36_06020 [Alphaproteobacteria bacterium]|jgi:hypothetical protein|nr:hypothetical protein [Alphaproteobacteria bacterium]MBP9777378.1 hypothetical protein [Alphaproteobacteria bacterium]
MKNLIYTLFTYAIIVCYSTIAWSADTDEGQKRVLQRKATIGLSEEGEREGIVYLKQSRLYKILFSPPGKYEIKRYGTNPELNGYKYVTLKNEEGQKEKYLLLFSSVNKDEVRLHRNSKLIALPIIALFPKIPAWGVNVDLPYKKKSSKKKI